jgi:demethylmenaquinone methyltransferase/2-methoxy-6-polyprenyl-1,4-benzoquinol methylase
MINQEANSRWDRNKLRNPHEIADKKQRVQSMFRQVSRSYDLVNHVLSLNMDRGWRRKAVRLARIEAGQHILDVCCGSGDMALAFAAEEPNLREITGVDFVESMLEIARRKGRDFHAKHGGPEIEWHCCDAENISILPDAQYDRVSCVFGVRNLQTPQSGLNEMYRLLKPGGQAIILEFDLPRQPVIRWLYQSYFRLVLPVVGSLLSQDRTGAYHYLPESVCQFHTREQLEKGLSQAGFSDVSITDISFGTVLAFVASKS